MAFYKGLFVFILGLLMPIVNAQAQVCHSGVTYPYKDQTADPIGLAPTGDYDLVYHRISVSVDPAVRYIRGSVTSYFKPLVQISQIAFDLTDTLSVDSVYYRGSRITTFTHLNKALTISFATPLSVLDSVTIFYSGVPPFTGFGSFSTDVHDSVPVLWTLSEPYGSRDWFPGKMTLTDKVDSLDMYINVPIGNRAASNGLLVDSIQQGNTITWHWRHRYPIANYLIGIAVTNYFPYTKTVSTQYGDIKVVNYCYPENAIYWQDNDSNIAKALQLYSNLFGPYPFIKEKYGHAQFNWDGGMEHQTMSFVVGIEFELVNHEMAHQWFGDKLTCGSWTDVWLNEGFAVYLSGLCYEYIADPYWWMAWRRSNLGKVVLGEGSVYCQDTTSVPRIFDTRISYSKGACILHMLRWELGDSNFFAALKNYVSDSTLIYSFSKTQLLQQHLERQSGKDLSLFFDQWFYGQGFPSYSLDWAQKDNTISGRLSQTTSHPSVSFYPMPVPIKFYGGKTDSTIIIDHTLSGQNFTIDLPFTVDSILIDPELWLVSDKNVVRKLPALDKSDFLILYPNPVTDIMTIWYDSRGLDQVSYSIWDLEGRKVSSGLVPQGNDYFDIIVSNLPAGMYLVRINTEKGSTERKIVKY